MKIIYLLPHGSFQTRLRSDTLWGILCWGIRNVYGETALTEMLEKAAPANSDVATNPEFTISSAFPFSETVDKPKEVNRYYPLPLHIAAQEDAVYENVQDYQKRKSSKKVKFLTEEDFKRCLRGELKKSDLLSTSSAEVKPQVESALTTHNTIDRINLSTLRKKADNGRLSGQLFHNEELFVDIGKKQEKNEEDEGEEKEEKKTRNGLFFLVRGGTDKVEAALRFFRHRGIGANSSAGKGTFDFRVEDFPEFPTPPNADALLNLSLWHPTKEEANLYEEQSSKNAYLLERRGGKVGQYLIKKDKKKVLCFKEGSVIVTDKAKNSKNTLGRVVTEKFPDIDHDIYRNYFGFMLKIKS